MTHQYKKLPVTMNMWMQFNVMPWTCTPSNICTEAVASILFPVDLNVAPPSSDVGSVAELHGLIVVPRRSLRRPVSTNSPSACFQFFDAFSVKRRVYRRRRRQSPPANDSLPCTSSAAALRYRDILHATRASHSCMGKHSLFL